MDLFSRPISSPFSAGAVVKSILPVLIASVALGMLSRSCLAQYGYPAGSGMNGAYGAVGPGVWNSQVPQYSGGPAMSRQVPVRFNGPVGQPVMRPAVYSSGPSVYQPRLTSVSLFQDGGVPIPSDAEVAPAATGTESQPGTTIMPESSVSGFQGPMNATEGCCGAPAATGPIFQEGTTWNAFSPPMNGDPFLGDPSMQGLQGMPAAPVNPYQPGMPAQGLYSYGANPAEPYRFGWNNRVDVSWLPSSTLSDPAAGEFEAFGIDYDLAYSSQLPTGWVFNWTNQFAYRNVNGGVGAFDLPRSLFRFGVDLELESPSAGPVSVSMGITPSINTDFASDPWSDGFQLDGRGIFLFRLDQFWTLGLGAMYWDRVNDRVLPYAGLIYRDDYWEWQLMYPEARVRLFLGNEAYWSKWVYVRAAYHVESYGIERTNGGVTENTQVEFSDYRILGGFEMNAGLYSWYIEGGWIMDRNMEFASNPSQMDIDSGFIGQIGLRY